MKLRELQKITVALIRVTKDGERVYKGLSMNIPDELLDYEVVLIADDFESVSGHIESMVSIFVETKRA